MTSLLQHTVNMEKEYGIFEIYSSTWNEGTRKFEGRLIKDGFESLEKAEEFLYMRYSEKKTNHPRCIILPIYNATRSFT